MKRLILTIAIISVFISSCLNLAWTNYKKPKTSDFELVGEGGDSIWIGKQNLNPHQWQAVKEAVSDVCSILSSKEFKERVTSEIWLASCGRIHGKADTISGTEVYIMLTQRTIKYSIHPHSPWNAEGQTETDEYYSFNNKIAIAPIIIEKWYTTSDSLKSELIDLIAHETVHAASERFLDYDKHTTSSCPDSLLVSYGIGNLVRQMWLERKKGSN